jgi:hypothetical protein
MVIPLYGSSMLCDFPSFLQLDDGNVPVMTYPSGIGETVHTDCGLVTVLILYPLNPPVPQPEISNTPVTVNPEGIGEKEQTDKLFVALRI